MEGIRRQRRKALLPQKIKRNNFACYTTGDINSHRLAAAFQRVLCLKLWKMSRSVKASIVPGVQSTLTHIISRNLHADTACFPVSRIDNQMASF